MGKEIREREGGFLFELRKHMFDYGQTETTFFSITFFICFICFFHKQRTDYTTGV